MTDAPATPTFPARQAEPGQAFTWHDQWGERHEFAADDAGVLRPSSQAEAEACASFGLPVIEDQTPAQAPTKAELRARAEELGLTVPAKATNVQLVDAIAAAEAATTSTDTPAAPAQED